MFSNRLFICWKNILNFKNIANFVAYGIIDANVYYDAALAKCRFAALGSLLSWYNEKRLRYDVLWAFAWRMFFYIKGVEYFIPEKET
ncbi:MAG: hypothetical protein E7243_24150 [Lacrimispora celerecrescens]|uniref:hypothetical protein n=1 Tax=Lacrimispora indolis TaxID=69825 RepID=UPI0004021A96|nr:hypothetical protein [[Clostridium] methoxybenzovorans]MBE7722587.1 hypothetical protein [Lacrimispora celerecrescens]